MLVHFASGTHPFPSPWHNVDVVSPSADQHADLLETLPYNLTDIECAYVGHFLEHITPEDGVSFLRRLRNRMVPGGLLVVVGPDVVKGQRWYHEGRIPSDLLFRIGKHCQGEPHYDCHLWECTGDKVLAQLNEAGWNTEEFPLSTLGQAHPQIPIIDLSEWQFAIAAYNSY